MLTLYIFYHPFTLKICKTLYLKWFSCRQNIIGSYIFIHSFSFSLLIGVFRPLIFKVIIDTTGLIVVINQLLNCVQLFVTPWTGAYQAPQFSNISQSFLKFLFIESMMLSNHHIQWIFGVNFLQDWLIWFPFSPKDSQESSPAPWFESISSLAPSLLYGPNNTSVHDYWKN